jgi:F420-dependent oxidoreductase-like protein
MRFALMIEPQQDVAWSTHVEIAQRAEAAGFEILYRSDHYESFPGPAGMHTTDAWATIAGLVHETSKLRHGTMVSPVTFRHPANVAKVVATIDEMSGGRVELGLGAGWNEVEHTRHGLAFHDWTTRIEMMEEQFQIVRGFWTEGPGWSFRGQHYTVEDTRYAPRPVQQPGVPLIMGTVGVPRGLRTAARWSDHLNLNTVDPEAAAETLARFRDTCAAAERDPGEVLTSVLCAVAIGADRAEADRRIDSIVETMEYESAASLEAERGGSWAIGTPDQAAVKIREYRDAGVEMIVLQDFLPHDLDYVDLLGALAREWAA